MAKAIEVRRMIYERATDEGGLIRIIAELPIYQNENGDGYVIDLEGKDDLILHGDTKDEVAKETIDALCTDVDQDLESGRRLADYQGVTYKQYPPKQWVTYPAADHAAELVEA